jgi:hypothetical protein
MGTSEFAVISRSTLDHLFHGKSVGELLVFENIRCIGCGESVNIKIQKTSGGFGFLSGIISEPSQGQLLAKCSNCNGYKQAKGT